MARAFIAIELPFEVIEEFKNLQKDLVQKKIFEGKLTESENLHLTLKFLGEISEEKVNEVKKRLSEIKFNNFSAELGEIGVFSRNFPRIVWVKLDGQEVYDLQKQIDEKLSDLFKKEERFMSHITIARVRNIFNKKDFFECLDNLKTRKIRFLVKEIKLKKSVLFPEGPKYEILENYLLN